MKTFIAVAALLVATPALSQTPKATPPARPAAQSAADTFKGLSAADRQAVQSDLAWIGAYNGNINGEFSDATIAAIKSFQQRNNARPTGVLNPQERAALASESKKLQENAGWKMVEDMSTGIRLGVPLKLAPNYAGVPNGAKWSSQQGQVQVEVAKLREAGITTATAAARERAKAPPAREIKYSVVRPDFFVLSGMQGLKKFYLRGQLLNGEVRTMTILYDQATEGVMEPVVIAMSSAFNPFRASDAATPPPRRAVEYATGVVVGADGAIVTDRSATDACQTIVVAGKSNADRVANDEKSGLALLRIYGVGNLVPLALGTGTAKPDLTLTGIADPQAQNGGDAVTSVAVKAGGETLTPAPAQGFAGAPAFDAEGKFAGLATLRPAQVAGPAPAASQAALISADAVRGFLTAQKIAMAQGAANAKAAVVRVICVRK